MFSLLLVLSVLHLTRVWPFYISPAITSLHRALFAAITFHFNVLQEAHGWLPTNWTVLWSLSVEEMFYLFFPVLCIIFLRKPWGAPVFVGILCGLVVLGAVSRMTFSVNAISADESYLSSMDGVALGCLTAMLMHRCSANIRFVNSKWPVIFQGVGAILLLFVIFTSWPQPLSEMSIRRVLDHTGTSITVLISGACMVMFGSVLRPVRGAVWTAPIRWFGRHSYEIYLTHEFAILGVTLLLIVKLHRGPMWGWICLILATSAGLGYLMTRFISEPANRALRGAPLPSQYRPANSASGRKVAVEVL